MKITLTREEMLALWRRMRTVEPLRLDCSVGRTDSVDIDAILDGEMRLWYLNMLDSADPDLLPVENVADAADCSTAAPSSVMTVRLPEQVRRVVSVRFSQWESPIAPDADPEQVRRCAANPLWHRPLAGAISRHTLTVCQPGGSLEEIMAVTDPGPETYIFDESLLNTVADHATF